MQTNVATEDLDIWTGNGGLEADESLGLATMQYKCFDIGTATKMFEVRIRHVENFTPQVLRTTNKFFSTDIDNGRVCLFVALAIYYGGELIAPVMHTQPVAGIHFILSKAQNTV